MVKDILKDVQLARFGDISAQMASYKSYLLSCVSVAATNWEEVLGDR